MSVYVCVMYVQIFFILWKFDFEQVFSGLLFVSLPFVFCLFKSIHIFKHFCHCFRSFSFTFWCFALNIVQLGAQIVSCWKSYGNLGGLRGARRIYLHIYSLVQWVPRANLSNDDNKWACEMFFFENCVPQYPPFCDGERWFFVWWDVMEVLWSDPDSAGFRDSHYSQIKCRWLDAASSSIFSLFPHLKLHFNSSYFINIFFLY